jgi:ankyrin repeat protein
VDELLRIGKQQLMPLKGDWTWLAHGGRLDVVVSGYTSLLAHIQEKLLEYTGEVARIIIRATLDIMYTSQSFDEAKSLDVLESTLAKYKTQKNHGIATLLQISKLRHPSSKQSDTDVKEMILDRNAFINCLSGVLQKHVLRLEDDEGHVLCDLTRTQLFMPSALFQIPAIAKAIEDDGRIDCLGRPVGHMFHDNKVDEHFRYIAYEDGRDVLGRSRLHIACSLTASHQTISDLKAVPRLMWSNHFELMLGMSPLHLTSIHGNVEVFKIVLHSVIEDCDQTNLLEQASMFTGRTCLHWAACFGHMDLVGYLYNTDVDSFQDILISADEGDDSPLHLAALKGHLDLVKSMSQVTNWETMGRLFSDYTPFWAATSGRHLEIMEFLEPFCDIDETGNELRTPLAEAARQGFRNGVDYLLQLHGVSINSIGQFLNNAKKKYCQGTPLDFAIEGGHWGCIVKLRQHGALTYSELELRKSREAVNIANVEWAISRASRE